jgi:hypothetical protein
LNDAVLPNRIDQFLQRFAPKILPRLQGAWDNACQADLVHSPARLGHFRTRDDGRRANQRTKPFAQTRTCHASQATGTASPRQTAIRAEHIDAKKGRGPPPLKKNLKKVLTLKAEIQYQRVWL